MLKILGAMAVCVVAVMAAVAVMAVGGGSGGGDGGLLLDVDRSENAISVLPSHGFGFGFFKRTYAITHARTIIL